MCKINEIERKTMGSGNSKIVELSNAIEEANKQLRKIKEYIDLVDKQIETLRTNISTSMKELKACNDSLDSHRKQVIQNRSDAADVITKHMATEKELTLEVESQKQKLQQLDAIKKQLEVQSQKLEAELGATVKRNSEYADRIKSLIGEEGKNKNILAGLKEQLSKTQIELKTAQSKGSEDTQQLRQRRDAIANQIKEIENRLTTQKKVLEEKSAQMAGLKTQVEALKKQVADLESQIKQSDSSGQSSAASKQVLEKQKSDLEAKLKSMKEQLQRLTVSQAQKERAAKLLSDHTSRVKEEIKKVTNINVQTKASIESEQRRMQKDAQAFEEQTKKQKEDAEQKIKQMEDKIRANQAKLKRLEAALEKAQQVQAALKKDDEVVTKLVENLTADLKRLEEQLKQLNQELARLKQTVQDTRAKIDQLNKSITSRLDGQFFKKEPSRVYQGRNISQSNANVEACLRKCAEDPNCKGFSLSASNECVLKSDVQSSTASGQHTSYMRYSEVGNAVRKQLTSAQGKLDECETRKKDFTSDIETQTPLVVQGKCKIMGMEVKNWWSDGKVCYQACPSGSQTRHSDGRCKCGGTDKCPAGTICKDGKCVGTVFVDSSKFESILGPYKPPKNNKAKKETPPPLKQNCELVKGKVVCTNEISGYVLHPKTELDKSAFYWQNFVNNVDECIARCNKDSQCAGFTIQSGSRRYTYQNQSTYPPYCSLARKGRFAPGRPTTSGIRYSNSYFKLDPSGLKLRQGEFVVKLGDLTIKPSTPTANCCFTGAAQFGLPAKANCLRFRDCQSQGLYFMEFWPLGKSQRVVVSYKPAASFESQDSKPQQPFAQHNGKDVYFVRKIT